MCKFMVAHPRWFAAIQSLVDILGEATPIMVVFTMQVVFQVCKRRKRRGQDPNDTMTSTQYDQSQDL